MDSKRIGLIVGIVIAVIIVLIIIGVIVGFIVKRNKDKKAEQEQKANEGTKESFSRTMLTNASRNSRVNGIQENYSDPKISNTDERIKKFLSRWA